MVRQAFHVFLMMALVAVELIAFAGMALYFNDRRPVTHGEIAINWQVLR